MDQKKLFWVLVSALGVIASLALPFLWSLAAMPPIFFVSWWVVYRSDWL